MFRRCLEDQSGLSRVGWIIGVVLLLLLGNVIFTVFGARRSRPPICQFNLKQLGIAARIYTQDYDGMYMLSKGWASDKCLNLYINNGETFNCTRRREKMFRTKMNGAETDYEYNLNVAGKRLEDVKCELQQIILMGDSDTTVRATDEAGTTFIKPHSGGTNFVMLDGHAEWVKDGAIGGRHKLNIR